jgi:hypothetical protein
VNNSLVWFIILLILLVSLFLLLRLFIRRMNSAVLQENAELTPVADDEANNGQSIISGNVLSNESGNFSSDVLCDESSGEPQIPKAKVTPEELGAQFVKWLQTDPPTLPLNVLPIDRFTTEFVYLQTFTFDLAAYLELGDTYEKKVILDVFWDYITGAGVYTETFQLRMLRYTDAVKEAAADNIHEILGHAFAEICGTPGEENIVQTGANTVHFILNRISQLFDHVTVDMSIDMGAGALSALEST